MNNWRLILNSPSEGAWNMAVDEAILESSIQKKVLPTLRLFAWHPYTLSLGHAQPVSNINLMRLNSKGWGLVRRPTGGKAILHADEMTYSVCAPNDNLLVRGNVIESYRRLSQGLLQGLAILGIAADSKPKNENERGLTANPVCFQYPSDYEITFNNKKLIGSAQARKKNGVLQHGSIPLFGDISRITQVLNYKNEREELLSRDLLITRATTIFEILKRKINWFEMAEAITLGFSKALNIQFIEDRLTRQELERSYDIYRTKYSNQNWTFRI